MSSMVMSHLLSTLSNQFIPSISPLLPVCLNTSMNLLPTVTNDKETLALSAKGMNSGCKILSLPRPFSVYLLGLVDLVLIFCTLSGCMLCFHNLYLCACVLFLLCFSFVFAKCSIVLAQQIKGSDSDSSCLPG